MKFLFAAVALVGLVSVEAGSYQCGDHEEYASGKCLCKLGYIRHQGVCKRCPENSKYSCRRNICVCAKGYTYDAEYHECLSDDDSTYGSQDDSYGSSQQDSYGSSQQDSYGSSQQDSYGSSQQDSYGSSTDNSDGSYHHGRSSHHGGSKGHKYRCGPYEISTPGGGCDCDFKNGYARLDGVNCLKCPKNGHWEAGKNRCECNFDFKFNNNGECVPDCKAYEVFTPGGGCDCDSKNGYARLDGVNCLKCPKNGHWEAGKNRCECNFDFKFNNNGECVPDCKANEVFTPGGGCTCKPKYNKYDGVNCTRCPSRSWYDVATDDCVCEWGFVMQNYKCVPKSQSKTKY